MQKTHEKLFEKNSEIFSLQKNMYFSSKKVRRCLTLKPWLLIKIFFRRISWRVFGFLKRELALSEGGSFLLEGDQKSIRSKFSKTFELSQGLKSSNFPDPPDFRKVVRISSKSFSFFILWFWKKSFFQIFSIFLYKKNRKICFYKNSPTKFNRVPWMKFPQFKDNLFKALNIQRPFWLKMWHYFFSECFSWWLKKYLKFKAGYIRDLSRLTGFWAFRPGYGG